MLLQVPDVGDPSLYLYLILGLLAAIVSWVNKRKEAAKRDRLAQSVPTQQASEP